MPRPVYFLSDLHLGASYIPDPRAHERRVVKWLETVGAGASRIYLLGDVLDYWFEYSQVVPKGYIRFFGALAKLADSGVEIVWFKGNHDIWLFSYLQREIGVKVVDGNVEEEIYGRRFFMAHGDGIPPLGFKFKALRWLFRNRLCQRLFSAVPSAWTVPFAHGWSSSSRGAAAKCIENDRFDPTTDNLLLFARRYLESGHDVDYFIFGHKHLLVDYPVGEHSRLIILGDWISRNSYARWDGSKFTIHVFDSGD